MLSIKFEDIVFTSQYGNQISSTRSSIGPPLGFLCLEWPITLPTGLSQGSTSRSDITYLLLRTSSTSAILRDNTTLRLIQVVHLHKRLIV